MRAPALLGLLALAPLGAGLAVPPARPAREASVPRVAPAAAETLTLAALLAEAERRDPRAAQAELEARRSGLRERSLTAERLPRVALAGEGSYQTAVPELPAALLGRPGAATPTPPKVRYQATVVTEQLVYDGGAIGRRREVERARLAEARAGVRAAVATVRDEVTAAFFGALLARERDAQLAVAADELSARLAAVRARHDAGAALPGDTAAVRAELLRVGQRRDEAAADRRAALAVLAALVGRPIGEGDALAVPDLAAAVLAARAAGPAALDARPEMERFDRVRERLAREADVAAAATRPRIAAFGQGGWGRPGLNVLGDELRAFAIAGVRVSWPVVDWGTGGRDRDALLLQRRVVDTEEAAFRERIARSLEDELAAIDRLEAALAVDDTIVALRERVEFEARRQLEEGTLAAADYVARRGPVTEARLARAARRVALAHARAAYLTAVGAPPR